MKISRNCFLAIFILFTVLSPAFSQQRGTVDPWWYTLEQGKRFFRGGDYGDALRCFEDARENRKQFYTRLERNFITVLSIHEVRLMGDDLAILETYIQKQYRTDAAEALQQLYYRVPKDSLKNSAKRALSELGRLKNYPEAEYWIGESYRAEGELSIALKQYQTAYNGRAGLETPGFETEILYRIADTRRLRQEYNEMESAFVEILKLDSLWGRESFSRAAMLRSLENNGLDRFLVLYRHNNPLVEKAHRMLGMYYYASGRHNRAVEHLLFAFLIQNTLMVNTLIKEKYDYSFTTLEALLRDASSRTELQDFMKETEYFKTLYYLANSFYGNGKNGPAREIWVFLRDNTGISGPAGAAAQAGEWRSRALNQLRNPVLDFAPETAGRPGIPAQSGF
jgi:tetratricopeptide (TPR) repeat protein